MAVDAAIALFSGEKTGEKTGKTSGSESIPAGGNVAALGTAKVLLGWPLWVGALAVMGAMLMRGSTPHTNPS